MRLSLKRAHVHARVGEDPRADAKPCRAADSAGRDPSGKHHTRCAGHTCREQRAQRNSRRAIATIVVVFAGAPSGRVRGTATTHAWPALDTNSCSLHRV